ncbi:MAG TPA: MFS transporter [Bacillota bacterium]|nr:MFS transporter [Bacillota bacterium]
MLKKWSAMDRQFKLLLLVWLFVGITSGIYDTVFSNYLNEVFHISAKTRGFLELPREFPGFIVALVSGVLVFLSDVRMLGVAVSLVSLGMFGQSFYNWGGEPQFAWMVSSMFIWSIGTHLFLPVSNSLSIDLAKPGQIGKALGVLNAANTMSFIIGCASIWFLKGWLKLEYSAVFQLGAFFALLAVGCSFLMRTPAEHKPKTKFKLVFRKEYSVFYWLSVLYGARKQIFLTFAPWVLIKVYHLPVTAIAQLIFIASIFGIVFKYYLGKLIDRIGERTIIIAESSVMFLVCLGYGFAGNMGLGNWAIYLVYLCYILDNMLMAITIARTTYLHKNLVDPEDLTPSLSMGVSMDHLVAMTLPSLGGLLWNNYGFEYIFLFAALIALLNIGVAWKIKQPAYGSGNVPGSTQEKAV